MKSRETKQVILTGENPKTEKMLGPLLAVQSLQVHRLPLAREAAAFARTLRPDLVIALDPLPDSSCSELVEWIRRDGPTRPRPQVLWLTDRLEGVLGHGTEDDFIVMSADRPAYGLRAEVAEILGISARASWRLMVRLQVHLVEGNALRMVQAENLSETGMLIRTDHLLPIGSLIGLQFPLALGNRSKTISVQAEVVRHTAESEGIRGAGLRFVEFRAGDRRILEEFLGERTTSAPSVCPPVPDGTTGGKSFDWGLRPRCPGRSGAWGRTATAPCSSPP